MSSRREFLQATLCAAVVGASHQALAEQLNGEVHDDLMRGWTGDEVIAMVLYDGFTALDLFGPRHMLSLMGGAKIHLVAATLDPITAEGGVKVAPTLTFDDCPEKLTVLFVPGGSEGTLAAMKDEVLREFVRSRGEQADWVTSVCTGSFILAAAGLLDGYKATSHWVTREVLAEFGALPVDERVVVDRNRITGAGVTAGLDLGLRLVGQFRGDTYGKGSQLFAEYDPQPPYDTGSPAKAPPEVTAMLRQMHAPYRNSLKAIAATLPDGD